MLISTQANPMLAVKNIQVAQEFYQRVMELEVDRDPTMPMAVVHGGGTDFTLYESEFAGTNKANAMAWSVGSDFDSVIEKLKTKKIKFEHYPDLPQTRVEGDIHVSGEMKLAWFKDPDGNILHVNNMN